MSVWGVFLDYEWVLPVCLEFAFLLLIIMGIRIDSFYCWINMIFYRDLSGFSMKFLKLMIIIVIWGSWIMFLFLVLEWFYHEMFNDKWLLV